jgi:hypothetical protein
MVIRKRFSKSRKVKSKRTSRRSIKVKSKRISRKVKSKRRSRKVKSKRNDGVGLDELPFGISSAISQYLKPVDIKSLRHINKTTKKKLMKKIL